MSSFTIRPSGNGKGNVDKEGFTPSVYQSDIFKWIENGVGNAVVEATAGSGKTKTILEGLKFMKGRPLFTAFNKHIAETLKDRAPCHAAVSTIHSLGFSAIRKTFRSVKVDTNKLRRIVKEVMGNDFDDREARASAEEVARLVKLTLTDPGDSQAVCAIADDYEIGEQDSLEWIVQSIPEILEKCKEENSSIDFDDMIWFPSVFKLTPDRYDWVCIDELQDVNAVQRELVVKAVVDGGRVIAVGDKSQAIFGFMGADPSSMPIMTDRLNATTLPLSICYRCPTSHIDLAKRIVPQIEARPGAPAGVVKKLSLATATRDMKDGDMVICRINAPLVEVALDLIRHGKKASVRGRDISGNLIALIQKKKGNSNDVGHLLEKLYKYRDLEVSRLTNSGKEARASALVDKVETICALSEGLNLVSDLELRVDSIFSDSVEGVVCSSVHRAKGLEAERVVIYKPSLMPMKRAIPGTWQYTQEMNLKYVALTRAKSELWMVEDEKSRKRRLDAWMSPGSEVTDSLGFRLGL
jgi:superfamily I DNA/RNA helicase